MRTRQTVRSSMAGSLNLLNETVAVIKDEMFEEVVERIIRRREEEGWIVVEKRTQTLAPSTGQVAYLKFWAIK